MTEATKAIFLSYASQDADAAQRLCDALRTAGLEVWFDRSELRGGDAWDASIRRQIRECALFVPLISAHTDARSEGYFRREWNLAVDRMLDMAEDQPFLLPVAIDDTPDATARVPDRFRERQWTRLPGGAATPEWVERVARLLAGPATETVARRTQHPVARRRPRWLLPVAALAAAVIVGAVAVTVWKDRAQPSPPAPTIAAATAIPQDRKSIAVLPFENLSRDSDDAYLADGLQAEVLSALARVRDLKVISRTSVMEYRGKAHNVREVGQRLGVGTILEGSVRREGGKLRLAVQLVDANDDRQLLATNYDRDVTNLLDLQRAVAVQIVDGLAATLTRQERGDLDRVATGSGDAYDHYLKAMALLDRPNYHGWKDVAEPKRLLAEAVKLDPGYVDAIAQLSLVNTYSYYHLGRRVEDREAARQGYERALAIDPQSPEALLARGLYTTWVSLDPDQAVPDLEAAVRSRPNSAVAHVLLGLALRRRGSMDEALEHLVRGSDLDPLNKANTSHPLHTLLGLRRWPEAIEQASLLARRFPGEPWHQVFRARTESLTLDSWEPLRGALREYGSQLKPNLRAVAEYDVAIAERRYVDAARLVDTAWPEDPPWMRKSVQGVLYHVSGDQRRATEALRAAVREMPRDAAGEPSGGLYAEMFAIAQSLLGEHAAALATIDAARAKAPEARDRINGPEASFVRSVILVRAGRANEGYAEATRLLRVPFGSPRWKLGAIWAVQLLVKDDPHFDELINRPPRL